MKTSITGYLDNSTEGGKLENLIYSQVGEIYYLPKFGIDRDLFLGSGYPIQNQSFASYLKQVAMVNSIITTNVSVEIEGFTANVLYEISGGNSQAINHGFGVINVQ